MLESVLSSTGALVELQAPCLSGSVLALLLDYIYTGALPRTRTQEQYDSLLAAAHYLQMDRLQKELCDWERTDKTYSKTADTCRMGACRQASEREVCCAGSLEMSVIEAAAEAPMRSASREMEADASGAKLCRSRRNAHTGSLSGSSRNTCHGRGASHLTLQNQIPNTPSTTGGYSVSRVHKDTQRDRFHPAGTIKPGTWQNNTEEEAEGSSSPQPCCGAVPVICHSGRVSVFQLSQASVNPSGATGSQPPSTGYETGEHRNCYESEDPDDSGDDVPLPVEASDMGGDACRWDSSAKGEAKGEQVSAEHQSSSCRDLSGPDSARYTSTKEALSDQSLGARAHLPLPNAPRSSLETGGYFECSTSLDAERMSDPDTSEPLFGFTIPEDSGVSEPTGSTMDQSYRGHVRYHCIPRDDSSHQSSEEDEGSLRQHFTAGTSQQFLLLDISTKHAELLVSYKHRADGEQQGVTSGPETTNSDTDETSVARVETAGPDAGAQCFHQSKFSGTPERHCVAGKRSQEASKNHNSTLTICSAPSVPESARASVAPASMSAAPPARLSSPAPHHVFQCSLCDRSFSQRGSLNRHVRSHLGVRPFPCPRCPMTFSRQYRVTEHMRVHQRCTLGSDFPHPPASSI